LGSNYIDPEEVLGSLGLFVLPVVLIIFLLYLKKKLII
jgi:hypothetical protein